MQGSMDGRNQGMYSKILRCLFKIYYYSDTADDNLDCMDGIHLAKASMDLIDGCPVARSGVIDICLPR